MANDFDESSANEEASKGLSWWYSADVLSRDKSDKTAKRIRRISITDRLLRHPGRLSMVYFGALIITGNLLDAGVSDLWAKSVSQEHARILQRIGARHIINAETDAGKRVGHLVAGNYLDYIEIDGPYTVVKVHTPLYAVGRSIEDVQVHDKYGVTVVGLKAPGKEFQYGSKELVMHRNDELILMGKQDQIDHFIQG